MDYKLKQKHYTLTALVEGLDLKGDKELAKVFLSALMEHDLPNTLKISVPVARRLMAYPGWEEKLDVKTIRDYCAKRHDAMMLLYHGTRARADDYDPEAEYLSGIVVSLADKFGLS